MDKRAFAGILNEVERHLNDTQVKSEQNLTNFNSRVEHLRAVSGWSYEAIGEALEVSRTMLHYYRKGIHPPDAGILLRLSAAASALLLRDIDTVSLPIFGNLPAGWPQTRDGVAEKRADRSVPVRRGQFPEGAFGLEVRGESMNAATPRPILDGDIVVLLPPDQREPRHGDIVAALVDGETTLKRLVNKTRPAHLRSESHNPSFREIFPAHDLVIQGVVVGKL